LLLHPFLDNQISTRTKKPFSLGFQSNRSNCKQGYPLRDLNPCSRHEKTMSYTPRRKGQNFKEKGPARAALQEKEVAQSAACGSFMRHFSFSSTIIYDASNQKKKFNITPRAAFNNVCFSPLSIKPIKWEK
jgi:hypothetical protein